MRFTGVLAAVVLMLAAPAQADEDSPVKAGDAAQHRRDYGAAIGLYSRAMENSGVARGRRAEILVKRSKAYLAWGRFEDALRDANAAVEAKPGFARAFNSRGLAYAKSGLYQKAIADYGTAIEREPDFARAYNNRGRAYFFLGRFRQAAADFAARLKFKPRHVYPMLWLYLARQRSGASGAAELAANVSGQKGKHWIRTVAALYLGKTSAEKMLAAARHGDPKKRREREAEAFFYLGQQRLLAGDSKAAAKYFRSTLATGLVGFYEYTGAKVELQRMGIAR